MRFGAYVRSPHSSVVIETRLTSQHTLIEGVFLPAGTLLPKGANFAMQSTMDFGMHFPVSRGCGRRLEWADEWVEGV